MSLLQTEELAAGYGDFQALFGVSLVIEQGETVAIIGANGAGKNAEDDLRSLALAPTNRCPL